MNFLLKNLRNFNNKTFQIPIFKIPIYLKSRIQIITFLFFPNYLRFFSLKTAKLPNESEKFKNIAKKLTEVKIFRSANFIFKNITIYIRNNRKIFHEKINSANGVIFLVNPFINYSDNKDHHLNANEKKLYINRKKNIFYATADNLILNRFIEKKLNFVFFYVRLKNDKLSFVPDYLKKAYDVCKHNKNCSVVELLVNTNCSTLHFSSSIATVLAATLKAEKVKVYDWNFYMRESVINLNFIQKLFLMYPNNLKIKNNMFFELFLTHVYFVYRLKEQSHVFIKGHLSDFVNDIKIIKRVKKIFVN
jgi:hypothetical protein